MIDTTVAIMLIVVIIYSSIIATIQYIEEKKLLKALEQLQSDLDMLKLDIYKGKKIKHE